MMLVRGDLKFVCVYVCAAEREREKAQRAPKLEFKLFPTTS